jgi:4-aminobutyrate aminotransferase-like enzyme
LFDDVGRGYLDCVNNVAHVGHCHPTVVRAAQRQTAVLNTNTRYLHDNIIEYARRLTEKLQPSLSVCFFVNSGSEANDLALRLARAHTRTKSVIVMDTGYHGNLTSLVEISPYKFDGPGGFPAPPHVHKVRLADTYRGGFAAGDVREAVKKIGGRAVLIMESLLSCAGQMVLPDGYLADAYRAMREAGGLCIADEVQVGFGRVGSHFWGFETQGVVPDIVTMGKSIGGGHPLGAVVTTPEIAASFNNGMEYFNTYGGNPVSCAVGSAVLDVLDKEHLQHNALRVGGILKSKLTELKTKYSLVGDVRGLGLFVGIEFVRDRGTLEPAADEASYIVERMKDRGILLSTDGKFHNVIKIKPPMVFSESDCEFLVSSLDLVLGDSVLRK